MLFSLVLLLGLQFNGKAQDSLRIPVTDFDPDQLNEEYIDNPKWSILDLPKRDQTKYELTTESGRACIKAISENSASGLIYKVDIDPNEFPIIEWRWKIEDTLADGDYSKKSGDDYPARIYITFDYDKKNLGIGDRLKYAAIKTFTRYTVPLRAVNYIWANKAPEGTIAPNAYTDWVYMIAVKTGNQQAGDWHVEIQNILEDYRTAFGEEPPAITGVAIMTDSDNTKQSATAYYGDIIFRKAN
jgi:hypothetical protein